MSTKKNHAEFFYKAAGPNTWMKMQSDIVHLPKFANIMLIVMVIEITEIF